MAQKSNLITLRKKQKNLNFIGNEKESIKFLHGLQFLRSFGQLLKRKNILLVESKLNFVSNQSYLDLTLFYKVAKLGNYKKKMSKKSKSLNFASLGIIRFLAKEFSLLKSNFIAMKLNVINKKANKRLVRLFYSKMRRFSGALFSRRFNFFVDFLKASSLFTEDYLSIQAYLHFLGQIFKALQKKTHSRFLLFVRTIFEIIIFDSKVKRISKRSNVKGLKFVINGKLKGKTRSSSACHQFGHVPNSCLTKNITFSKLHVYTLYGVFGLRAWTNRA